jgi:hypothetical protein
MWGVVLMMWLLQPSTMDGLLQWWKGGARIGVARHATVPPHAPTNGRCHGPSVPCSSCIVHRGRTHDLLLVLLLLLLRQV